MMVYRTVASHLRLTLVHTETGTLTMKKMNVQTTHKNKILCGADVALQTLMVIVTVGCHARMNVIRMRH